MDTLFYELPNEYNPRESNTTLIIDYYKDPTEHPFFSKEISREYWNHERIEKRFGKGLWFSKAKIFDGEFNHTIIQYHEEPGCDIIGPYDTEQDMLDEILAYYVSRLLEDLAAMSDVIRKYTASKYI